MTEKKLAVIFPGIGYHKDKPLLYYASKLAVNEGYEVTDIAYHDMPAKIKGNAAMMKEAAELAFEQASQQLSKTNFSDYDKILLIGKSIGTIALAKLAADNNIKAKQIWYTPLEATFMFSPKGAEDVIAFIGDDDPWSDVDALKQTAGEKGIRLYSYPDCNHSLEQRSVDKNIENLREVMRITEEFLR